MEQGPEQLNENPLELALANLPEDQRNAFKKLDESYEGTGLRGLLSEALDPRHTPEHARQSLDQINKKDWNREHKGSKGIIMFANQDYTRQFQLTWSRESEWKKPAISVSYSVAKIK